MRQQREQREAGPDAGGETDIEQRQRIAGRLQPAVGRECQGCEGGRCQGKAQSEVAQRPGLPGRQHPHQSKRQSDRRDRRQAFDADGERAASRHPGANGEAGTRQRLHGAIEHQQRQQNLHRMMVDPARREIDQCGERESRQGQRRQQRLAPGQPDGDQRAHDQEAEQQDQRPNSDRDGVRHRPGQRTQEDDQRRDRQVDQPRPVQFGAEGGVEPVLHRVVPILAGKQVAYRREPHGIIGIGHERHRGRAVDRPRHKNCRDQREGEPDRRPDGARRCRRRSEPRAHSAPSIRKICRSSAGSDSGVSQSQTVPAAIESGAAGPKPGISGGPLHMTT